MKIKKLEPVYLEDYDIHVNPYLTTEQVQNIVNECSKYRTWGEREEVIQYMVLCYATDIGEDNVKQINPDEIVQSGLWNHVRYNIENFVDIDLAMDYEESMVKQLAMILDKLPDIAKEAVAKVNK